MSWPATAGHPGDEERSCFKQELDGRGRPGHDKVEMTRVFQAVCPENTPFTQILAHTETAIETILDGFCPDRRYPDITPAGLDHAEAE